MDEICGFLNCKRDRLVQKDGRCILHSEVGKGLNSAANEFAGPGIISAFVKCLEAECEDIATKIDLSGVVFPNLSKSEWEQALRPLHGHGGGVATDEQHIDLCFESAVFVGPVAFRGGAFAGVDFRRAVFRSSVEFRGSVFSGYAAFDQTRFEGPTDFTKSEFHGAAQFEGAQFFQGACFENASFKRGASFRHAEATGGAISWAGADFQGPVDFSSLECAVVDNQTSQTHVSFANCMVSFR